MPATRHRTKARPVGASTAGRGHGPLLQKTVPIAAIGGCATKPVGAGHARETASNEGKACRGIDRWSRAWPAPTETFVHGYDRWMHHETCRSGPRPRRSVERRHGLRPFGSLSALRVASVGSAALPDDFRTSPQRRARLLLSIGMGVSGRLGLGPHHRRRELMPRRTRPGPHRRLLAHPRPPRRTAPAGTFRRDPGRSGTGFEAAAASPSF